ncbi:hypothetical protein PCC7418_0640 [Halothece sp. PCC 7418]|uniref:hypothetical protein n=1 Tax=Halothece sp. (strain PCC 7418) TaxID=65093 RepID=UPI0002A07AF0|nr:hypothetical protein [Halothece sp. PCC 7418]AFZ42864.1 hypothetical protein PCC7418_0640 [Halothece sp. PCC 7418]
MSRFKQFKEINYYRLPILFIILVVGFSLNKNPFRAFNPPSSPPPIPKAIKLETWQQQLGHKMTTLRQEIPTASRVVVVPDTVTFLQAIQDWSLEQRYPILIADDYYTPLFLKRFQPEEVIRVASVKDSFFQDKKQLMEEAVAAAWESEASTLQETWQELGWQPPGVVITSVHDSAAVAAVALAADRGQPLRFLEGYFGKVNQTLSAKGWQVLNQEVQGLIASTGYDYQQLGDTIDTMTLVRELPVKYRSPKNRQLLAVTDGLGRHEDGQRYAIAGWIYGSAERAVYQAMCAIFLDADRALLYDSYPNTERWEAYHFEQGSQRLEKMGLMTTEIKPEQANQKTWQNLTTQPWNYDLIFMNSRGGKADFAVGNGHASVEDIPSLATPTAIHLIHSFSATTPNDVNTIAGRWLDYGVYAYVGSVDEPYVTGFVPPHAIIARLSYQVPFLVSARYVDTPPWKITTIGDPLMVFN